jgi:chorismate-pyruvate lyase
MPDFAFPLSEFYGRTSLALPRMEVIPGDAVPEPYRALLVHERDMTSTLERFYGGEIYIKALSSERRDGEYFREVVLHRASDDAPVEFGANCVSLNLFTPEARWMILQEKVPLGRILLDHAIPHTIRVAAFFRVQPDELIRRALKLAKPVPLYGRQAVLCNAAQQRLSQVVEILPPP